MGVLTEIQNELISEHAGIGSVLMKLRLLAAKLGSEDLEEWVKHESEGYPRTGELPAYRKLGMSFSGDFSGPFGSGIRNAPLPSFLIAQFAGEEWTSFAMYDSAAAVDSLVKSGSGVHLDLSNLILLIQGKIYENYACMSVKGYISHHALVELSNSIRNKILEFTIEFEKSVPGAADFELRNAPRKADVATKIYYQTVHGNITKVENTGSNVSFEVNVGAGDYTSLKTAFASAGLDESTSEEISKIISEEKPDPSAPDSLGKRARAWLGERITKGTDESVKGGVAALARIVQEAALSYWGLK